MKDFNKSDIQKVAKFTSWNKSDIKVFLEDFTYPNRWDWIGFAKILSLSLGAGLFGIGVVFFFAYNWDVIPKFTKLSIIFGLIAVFTFVSILPKFTMLIRQISLTLAATMVGVLFAVFGQIYQTGANAYDFFLAWSVFSLIWVLVARFIPLWILYIALLNVTLFFYFDQIRPNLSESILMNCFFVLNFLALSINCAVWYFNKVKPNKIITYLLALTCVSISTFYIGIFIFSPKITTSNVLFLLLNFVGIAFVTQLGFKYKQVFYIAICGLLVMISLCMIVIKIIDSDLVFFPLMLLVVGCTSVLVLFISNLLKKWKNE